MGETITMTKGELASLLDEAIAKASVVLQAEAVIAAPVIAVAPVDVSDFDHKAKGNRALTNALKGYCKGGDLTAPHSYGQRIRLLGIADRGGPSFDEIRHSGMNAITAAVASYWLEKGRPVRFKSLDLFVPRMA